VNTLTIATVICRPRASHGRDGSPMLSTSEPEAIPPIDRPSPQRPRPTFSTQPSGVPTDPAFPQFASALAIAARNSGASGFTWLGKNATM
jgi:hypothetical protein